MNTKSLLKVNLFPNLMAVMIGINLGIAVARILG